MTVAISEAVCCVCEEFACTRHSEEEHKRLLASVRQLKAEEASDLYSHARWHWQRLGFLGCEPWFDTAQDCWDYESHLGAFTGQMAL